MMDIEPIPREQNITALLRALLSVSRYSKMHVDTHSDDPKFWIMKLGERQETHLSDS